MDEVLEEHVREAIRLFEVSTLAASKSGMMADLGGYVDSNTLEEIQRCEEQIRQRIPRGSEGAWSEIPIWDISCRDHPLIGVPYWRPGPRRHPGSQPRERPLRLGSGGLRDPKGDRDAGVATTMLLVLLVLLLMCCWCCWCCLLVLLLVLLLLLLVLLLVLLVCWCLLLTTSGLGRCGGSSSTPTSAGRSSARLERARRLEWRTMFEACIKPLVEGLSETLEVISTSKVAQ